MKRQGIGRRELLKSAVGAAAGVGGAKALGLGERAELDATESDSAPMPVRRLGRTDYRVPLFSLGGQSTIEQPGRRDQAVSIIHRALDLGVNYIDTAAAYGQGVSESYIGEVMKERRKQVFLATKTRERTYDGALRECEASLKRLNTDCLDLYQHHAVHRDEQLEELLGRNGAAHAFARLHREGVIKHHGITGHSPRVLLKALQQYDFDCTLVTLNPADEWMLDREYLGEFLATAAEKDVGVIGMKVVARGRILERGLTMPQLMAYTLSFPVATVVIGITTYEQVEQDVEIACAFRPLSEQQRAELERRATA